MGDTTAQPGPELVSGGGDIIDAAAEGLALKPEQLASAKVGFNKLHDSGDRTPILQTTQSDLAALRSTLPKVEAYADDSKVKQVQLLGLRALALENFRQGVLAGGHDFMGDDSDAVETRANPIFKDILIPQMTALFGKTTVDWPLQYQKEWMVAVSNAMLGYIQKYSSDVVSGRMDEQDVKNAIEAVNVEVGTFEKWFEQKYPSNFPAAKVAHEALLQKRIELAEKKSTATATLETWKADKDPLKVLTERAAAWEKDLATLNEKGLVERAAAITALNALAPELKKGRNKAKAAAGTTALTGLKMRYEKLAEAFAEADTKDLYKKHADELTSLAGIGEKITATHAKVLALDTKLTAFPAAIIPKTLRGNVDALKDAAQKSDGSDIDTREGTIITLTGQVDALTKLNEAIDTSIPETDREKVLGPLREDKITVAVAIQQLGQLKKTAATAEAADAPWGDKILEWAETLDEGSVWKKALVGLAGVLALFAKGPVADFLGIRGVFSDQLLAEKFGDTKAAARIKVGNEFKQFGLPRSLATTLDGMKTKDVLEKIKKAPGELSADTAVQEKLAVLAREIEVHQGGTIEAPLYEFIGSSLWAGINYKAAVAAVTAAPAAAASGVPAATSDAKPAAAGTTETPRAPEVALTPEQERVKQLNAEIGHVFSAPQSPSAGIEFNLPYVKENGVATAKLILKDKILTVGGKRYEIGLPEHAEGIQSIAVTPGAYENGKAVLTISVDIAARAVGHGSKMSEVSLKTLFDFIEKLRTETSEQKLSTKEGELIFKPIA